MSEDDQKKVEEQEVVFGLQVEEDEEKVGQQHYHYGWYTVEQLDEYYNELLGNLC